MSYYIIFVFIDDLIKSNKIGVKFYKKYDILLKGVILSFNIVLSIKILINIDQIIYYFFIKLIWI